jgi:UDP-glucose 4-epimerase
MDGATVVVTGGAGFIGSHVAERFLARGDDVVVLDDLSHGDPENVPHGAKLIALDIRERDTVVAVLERLRPTCVCHFAAQASVVVSVREPELDLQVNVAGTENVLEAARRAGAKVCFASTGGALYGSEARRPTPETAPTEPLSPYGASKLAGEAYVATWGRLHGLPNQILRLANVYGPRQSGAGEAGVVAIFSSRLLAGEAPQIFGDGSQTRDYVYVGDVAEAFVLASERSEPGTYNIGTGQETSVTELLAHLQVAAGSAIEPEVLPGRPGDLPHSVLSNTRARAELGWQPQVTVADGLAQTLAWYRGNLDAGRGQ